MLGSGQSMLRGLTSVATSCRSRTGAWARLALLCMTSMVTVESGAVCLPTDPVNLDPIPAPIGRDAVAKVRLSRVASELVAPNGGSSAPGDASHLFVSDVVGQLWAIDLGSGAKHIVLDVTGLIVPLNPRDERGLLGATFHPDYQQNGLLYTYTSEPYAPEVAADFPVSGLAPSVLPDHRSVVTEWKVADPGAAQPLADPASRRVLLRIDQPQANHNAGALAFGPDGMLYVALGDGGAGSDQGRGHNPLIGNGQDRARVLGKILRIDPRGTTARNGQYSVPLSNPYAPHQGRTGGVAGCADGFCDEIWAYGFRNPYRISFDRLDGRLFAADVGQGSVEEVDIVRGGGNYGWRFKEGTFFFRPRPGTPSYISDVNCLGVPAPDLLDPVAQYDHGEGLSVIGGFVYRGSEIPALQGRYVFADLVGVSTGAGRLFYFDSRGVDGPPASPRTIRELRIQGRLSIGHFIFGFGQDAQGELYVMANKTASPALTEAGRTGVVFKLSAPSTR